MRLKFGEDLRSKQTYPKQERHAATRCQRILQCPNSPCLNPISSLTAPSTPETPPIPSPSHLKNAQYAYRCTTHPPKTLSTESKQVSYIAKLSLTLLVEYT